MRPIRGAWPAAFERRIGRYVWDNPAVVLDADTSAERFSAAMNAFAVGATVKITRRNRHPGADDLLLDNVDMTDATILDIGASDGSTSVDLIERLPGFKAYVIADRFLYVEAARLGSHTFFFEPAGTCVLVTGKRVVGWPTRSRLVATLYQPLIRQATRRAERRQPVRLLNPRTRDLIDSDPRVSATVHDIFRTWTGARPDVIKVANLLRRDYFDTVTIRAALRTLLDVLAEGGHLLLANNPPIKGVPYQGGLYRRSNGRFETVAHTAFGPDIDDLITSTRLRPAHAVAT